MFQWNEKYGVMCDIMGLPLSISEAEEISEQLKLHCAKSPEVLLAAHSALLKGSHPGWVDDFARTASSFK